MLAHLRALRDEWEGVEPPRRPVLLINPRSGNGKAARAALADRACERGVEPTIVGSGEDLAAVVAHALDGGADALDIAEVNGRPFLNNLSLGIYGDAVRRSGYRQAKVRTILETLDEVLTTTAPAPGLSITDDEGRPHPSPLVVLVSNNAYALGQPLVRGSRPRLDTGRLGVVVVDRPDRPGAARQAGHAWGSAALTIEATVPVPAGLDGESVTLQPPLRCSTRQGALRVRISRHHPGISPALVVASR